MSNFSDQIRKMKKLLISLSLIAVLSPVLAQKENKLIKAEKAKEDGNKNKLIKLQEKLFPQHHFQERHENFFGYYLADSDFIQRVIENVKAGNEPTIRILIV